MKKNNKIFLFLVDKVEPALFWLFLVFSFCGNTNLISFFGKNLHLSFWISLISLPIFLLVTFINKKQSEFLKLLLYSLIIFLPLSTSSFGNVLIFYHQYNGFLNENILTIWIENLIKYFYDILVIIYIIIHFQCKKIAQYVKHIYLIFACWVIIGFIQILLVLLNNDWMWAFYECLDILKILAHRDVFNLAGLRFYSFLSEPAQNAKIICLFFLPFFLVQCLKNSIFFKKRLSNIICLSITLICSFLTKSSTVYVGVLVCLAVFFLYFITKPNQSKKTILVITCILAFSIGILFLIPYTRNTLISILNDKIFTTNSFSTRYRYSSVYNDIIIFLKFPIFGVGDGLQGIFYLQNVGGTWMSYSAEAQASLTGKNGIIAGGAAIPSFISAFGIFGIFIVLVFLKFLKKQYSFTLFSDEKFKFYFFSALVSFIVVMTVGADFHRNYPLFIFLSTPFFGEYYIDNDTIELTNIYEINI